MYHRVLLKLSGEALKGDDSENILDVKYLQNVVGIIKKLHDSGFEIAVVIGAGNIWRGKLAHDIGIEPVQADFMGMYGTVINALAASSALHNIGVDSVVYSAIPAVNGITLDYDKNSAKTALNNQKVVFLAGGTGKPFFTTDTAATMRAIELDCDAIFMAKNGVDGVYDDDPKQNPNAHFIKSITYDKILETHLKVMDASAVELIKDTDIAIRVFNMSDPENFVKVAQGQSIGTICQRKEN